MSAPGAGLEQLDDLALENGFMREPGHPASRASARSGWISTPTAAAGVHEVAQVAARAGQAQPGDLAEQPRPGVVEVADAGEVDDHEAPAGPGPRRGGRDARPARRAGAPRSSGAR